MTTLRGKRKYQNRLPKSTLDVQFVKKIRLAMIIDQQMKEEGLHQNY